ncbi:hypothetical protein CY34DRAFT_96298 [Suillus luteus UH-Slu-Lm8-n1]|uniref:Uncharacterized protein n=1 Tax=Suillus luteus UH-Slu-Lm8-n1 TaxID=930992 RepID=A0A0D0A0I1_9AGAM|nr:hypothetical protein CY34DRAFT_96298 [Suillus luteus UH-Slu-Lm8-n1]
MVKSVNASARSARSVHLTRSPPPLPTIANDAVPSSIRPRFSLASLAAIYPNSFVEGHSNTERQAAARALLRHNANIDGTHFHTRKRGGLHPSYIAFNSYTSADEKSITQEELVEASLQDVFDAIVTQDRLDGGISLLIRCPGSEATATLLPEHISLDLYITPRELRETPERLGGDVSVLAQAFGEEFAIPHLQRCQIEGVVPPRHYPASQVNPAAPPHLPAPIVPTGAHIHCSARPSKQFQHDLQVNLEPKTLPSSAVREGRVIALANKDAATSTSENKIRHRRNADVFLLNGLKVPGPETEIEVPSLMAPLISIGPRTDAIIDWFKMDDTVLLRLHQLVGSVRSSRWEAVLRSSKWNLTYEEASNLTNALLADIQGTTAITKVFPFELSVYGLLTLSIHRHLFRYFLLCSGWLVA